MVINSGDMSFSCLESERLVLRRFKESDLTPFVRYRSHPEVERYQSWHDYTPDEGIKFLKEMAGLHPAIPGTWFQFAIELKTSSSLIGDCALYLRQDDPLQGEIGFSLAPEFQKHGFATEAINRLLEYIFGSLGKRRVIAVTDVRNQASIQVLERIGMRREAHFFENIVFKGELGSEYVYALLLDEWKQRKL
jgi:RimJ/RimL family protein N-acetyltransferase